MDEVEIDLKDKIKQDQEELFNTQFDIMSENMQAILVQAWHLTRKYDLTKQQLFLVMGRCHEFIDKLISVVGK